MKLLINILISGSFVMFLNTAHAEFPINNSTKISPDTLKKVVSGKFRHCTRDGDDLRTWVYSYYTNGKLKGENSSYKQDEGTWRINSNGMLCEDWTYEFTSRCRYLYQSPSNADQVVISPHEVVQLDC